MFHKVIVVDQKKKTESEILALFRNLYTDFPKGTISVSESPDFILRSGPKRKIGIELTRLHRKKSSPGQFSFENIKLNVFRKEEKLGLYRRKRLDEYWLILIVRDQEKQPPYNLFNKLMVWQFQTGFNKLFLLNPQHEKIFELRTY